jgi:flavin reductase (DIM6/NTAB) family NADH-FMN oxidoreductase RutF
LEQPATELDAAAAYALMIRLVVPRPIAWVTTIDENGVVNAAPFSFFTPVCSEPPLVAVAIGRRPDTKQPKDSAANAARTGEFVVNLVPTAMAEAMKVSASEWPAGVSEIEAAGLQTAPSRCVGAPRIVGSPAALECRVHSITDFGRSRTSLVVGEIVHFYVSDDAVVDGKVDAGALDPLGRLGGTEYSTLGELLTLA